MVNVGETVYLSSATRGFYMGSRDIQRTTLNANPISSTIEHVLSAIRRAELDSARTANSVELVCVSKTIPQEIVRHALECGQRVFGENRVQEAQSKWPELKREFPDVELHLIGPLQSNKVRDAMLLFEVIETVDRPKLAEAIAKERDRLALCPRLFVEVNTGSEPQKTGVAPSLADRFIEDCRARLKLPIEGLMCIPPMDQSKSPHFALLAAIAKRNGLKHLSMGMTADFQLAIQLGATHVRLGAAIFGARA
jgi:pyridoxal phosphate enzyme (YggS family)